MAHNRKPVTSTSIASIGFEPDASGQAGTVSIEFMNGKVYEAANVATADYDAFEGSTSLGAHFNRVLKSKYDFRKVGA